MQHLPRHVAGIVAGEEQEGGRDLVGLAGAANRGVLAEMRELFLVRPARRIARGPDRPRRDRVDADAVTDQVLGPAARDRGGSARGWGINKQIVRSRK